MLGLFNTKTDLTHVLKSVTDILVLDVYIDPHPDLSGLFIDWIPDKSDSKFAMQGIYVEHYAKAGVPIVIFDRFLALNNTEYSWLKKFNITFCEPVLKCRPGFQWFPMWVEVPFKYEKSDSRKYVLTYNGSINDRIAGVDKYYKQASVLLPTKEISICSNDITDLKSEELKKQGMVRTSDSQYSNASSTVLIGSDEDYTNGRLPNDLFDIMRSGCVPLLPIEHRFYCGGFADYIIRNNNDLEFLLSMSANYGGVLIEGLMEQLVRQFPEFDINFAVEKIKGLLI